MDKSMVETFDPILINYENSITDLLCSYNCRSNLLEHTHLPNTHFGIVERVPTLVKFERDMGLNELLDAISLKGYQPAGALEGLIFGNVLKEKETYHSYMCIGQLVKGVSMFGEMTYAIEFRLHRNLIDFKTTLTNFADYTRFLVFER